MNKKAYMVPNPLMPGQPLIFNPDICNGCNTCVDVCRRDVLMPNPIKGKHPIVLYPDECWFCGNCVEYCPRPGASKFNHPLVQKIGWVRKDTGKFYRVGMKNPPPPIKKPPIG